MGEISTKLTLLSEDRLLDELHCLGEDLDALLLLQAGRDHRILRRGDEADLHLGVRCACLAPLQERGLFFSKDYLMRFVRMADFHRRSARVRGSSGEEAIGLVLKPDCG